MVHITRHCGTLVCKICEYVYHYSGLTCLFATEIYDEQHVQDLVGGERDNGVWGTERHIGVLYNPSIPVDPPKVCLCLLPIGSIYTHTRAHLHNSHTHN